MEPQTTMFRYKNFQVNEKINPEALNDLPQISEQRLEFIYPQI